jgi:antitoxin FitA
MSVALTIRDVPQEVRDELASRAARKGQSLQEYLRTRLIAEASKPSSDDLITLVRNHVARSGTVLSVEEILDARDADRR